MSVLNEIQKVRYSRNILLPEIGISGQQKLLNSRVLVVGAGGLGSPALFYLACAGVGTIGIVDPDRVALSNLQRQILHTTQDLDELKTHSAKDKLRRLNPDVAIELYSEPLTQENGVELIKPYEFVIEAADNFKTKFLVNDICVRLGVPFCHAGILGMFGQMLTVVPGKGACYRCVFGDIPEKDHVSSTADAGVLGAVSGVFGALQTTETVKFLIGGGKLLVGRLLTYDALNLVFREIELPPPSCKVCRAAKLI
ncbi:MAG: HesA/MoeB/ThiF family protein [Desulfobacterales bacterium]